MTAQLTTRAFACLFEAFRPGTQRCYSRMFYDFLGFLVAAGLSLQQVDISVILTFMEYFHSQNYKMASISNYMAALRAFFILYDLPTAIFKDHKIQYFIKALKLNRPLLLKNSLSIFFLRLWRFVTSTASSCFYHCLFVGFLLLYEIVKYCSPK